MPYCIIAEQQTVPESNSAGACNVLLSSAEGSSASAVSTGQDAAAACQASKAGESALRLPSRDTEAQREERLETMSNAAKMLIEGLGEDTCREGLLKTPRRVARALLEMTSGYGVDAGAVLRSALFSVHSPDLVVVQDIDFSSQCEHHMLPFFGKVRSAHCGK